MAFTIITEGVVSMALLIPATYNWIREKGKVEGKAEGRKAQQKRTREAFRRFGVETDAGTVLLDSPEVRAFLNQEPEEDEDSKKVRMRKLWNC